MARLGRRNRPYFRINVIDSRTPRDGKIIEKLGHYDPIEKDKSKQVVLNTERVKYWLDKGAIPSDTVSEILLKLGIKTKYAQEKTIRRNRARTIVRVKGLPFTKAERAALEKAAAEAKETKPEVKTETAAEKTKAQAEVKAEAAAEPKAKEEVVKEAEAKPEPKQEAEEKQKPEKKEKPVRVKKTDKSDEN
jgi:small subunit ribosomal protein S16